MAARGNVFLDFDDGCGCRSWTYRTDLTGHGIVYEGEEFVARATLNGRLMPAWGKYRVRVKSVEKRGTWHVLHVEVLEDLTPQPTRQDGLF